jgi:hypothetical protein
LLHRKLVLLLIVVFCIPAAAQAQRRGDPQAQDDTSLYGTRFFDQLRGIFGKFRDSDLQRAFQLAEPANCADLVSDKGEWRSVAFLNEDRRLGDWHRDNIAEVKADPAAYIFGGVCRGDRGAVQVRTRFPVGESVDDYNAGRIRFDQIVVSTNPPVSAVFDSRTQAYSFDLPYLYRTSKTQTSLSPPLLVNRGRYITDVSAHFNCKAVRAPDVTYRFLVCETFTRNLDAAGRAIGRDSSFGSSAYIILSDGTEAAATVKLTFGDLTDAIEPAPSTDDEKAPLPSERDRLPRVAEPEVSLPGGGWGVPVAASKVMDVEKEEFRILFSAQTWNGKIGSPEILLDQKISGADSTKPKAGADYCTWRPGSSNMTARLFAADPDQDVSFSVEAADKNGQTPASITFGMKAFTGFRLGTLQCFFPGVESAKSIDFDRWVAIVGAHLTLEIRQ